VREWHVNRLWTMTAQLNVLDQKNWTAIANHLLDNLTREIFLATTSKGFDGSSDERSKPRWNFAGALLYSVTVITTIGYLLPVLLPFTCIVSGFTPPRDIPRRFPLEKSNILNPLDSKGNYSVRSNNRKLVHWPLSGLLHSVQRGGA